MEKIKELLLKYPVKDVIFGYDELTLVLSSGHEITIDSCYDDYDERSVLEILAFEVKKEKVEKVAEVELGE
jgi:predicted kinase